MTVVGSIDELWGCCDYITLHLPLNDHTRHMVGAQQLSAMKPGAVLLNLARGGLVDEAPSAGGAGQGKPARLCDRLPNRDGYQSPQGAAHPPTWALPPRKSEENCALMAAQQLRDYLEQGVIRNSVNYPAFDLPKTGALPPVHPA